MKLLIFLSSVLLLAACGRNPTGIGINEQPNPGSARKPEAIENKVGEIKPGALHFSDLAGKVFEIGSATHFTDTCAFYFECDCCAGDLVFNADRTFYVLDHCMSDKSLASGNYALNKGTLTLSYNGICVFRKYNWENEADTSAVDFFMTDTLVAAKSVRYTADICDGKIKLTRSDKKEMGIQSDASYAAYLEQLKQESFTERLNKLMRSAINKS
jgi:hypothetical protein